MMATIGASLLRVTPGEVDIALAVAPHISQQHGFVHGGAITSVADSAAGYAALTLMEAGTGILAVEFKINLLAPGRGERLVAEGRVVRPGRTLTVSQASVYAERDGRRERWRSHRHPDAPRRAERRGRLICRPARLNRVARAPSAPDRPDTHLQPGPSAA
jgi:uncharacterized protein (TIGR00369 family)